MNNPSGMIFSKIEALQQSLEKKSNEINNILNQLLTTRMKQVENSYSGTAANIYTENVQEIANQISTDLSTILNHLKVEIKKQEESYKIQDEKLAKIN